jgi:myo-inositol-1(or 4)-monophosphatase
LLRIYESLKRVNKIESSGSPILDLCGVAAGRVDGFYECGLEQWDIVAGTVIARAAGAKVTILLQQELASPLLVVSTPGIHEGVLELVIS